MTVDEAIENLNQAVERYSGMHLSSEAFAKCRAEYGIATEALIKAVREETIDGFANKVQAWLKASEAAEYMEKTK